ncbi:MAG: serine/threonine-protein kinase, partial [Microbacterium sp.]
PLSWAGEDDRVLFTMPLVGGGTAATLLGDFGPLPEPWAARILRDVLSALAEIHALGIVHRDVKPANVLLQATGAGEPHALLSDFGTAVVSDEPRLTRAHVLHGTAGYAPPEAMRGADPAPAADVYAAGATLVELLSGDRPQPGVRPVAPGALSALVDAMTHPDPDSRPDAATARRMLLATGLTAAPLTGEVEVFDQLPPLPAGWTEAGPESGSGISTQPVVLVPGAAPPHPLPRPAQPPPHERQPGAVPVAPRASGAWRGGVVPVVLAVSAILAGGGLVLGAIVLAMP